MKGFGGGGVPRLLSLQNILQALFLFVVFEIFEQFVSTLRDGGGQRGGGLSSVSLLASSKVNSQAESKIRGGLIEAKTVVAAAKKDDGDGWRCPFKRKPISCGALDRARWEASEDKVVMCLWDSNSQMHKEQLSQFNKPRDFKWTRNCVPGYVTQLFALASSTHYEVDGDTERQRNDYGHYPSPPMMPMMMIPVPYMPGYPGMHSHSRPRHHQTYDE